MAERLATLPTRVWSSARPSGRIAHGPEAVFGNAGDECCLCMETFADNAAATFAGRQKLGWREASGGAPPAPHAPIGSRPLLPRRSCS